MEPPGGCNLFEVDFDTDPADLPTAWTDLSDRIIGTADATQGVGRTGRFDGAAQVTLNNRDRALDPTNSSGPYTIIPMRHARICRDGTPIFVGYVESWSPWWTSEGDAVVQVRLVDASAWFALQTADVDLPAQPSHERVEALLDLGGWPASRRDIGDGVVTVQPTQPDDRKRLTPDDSPRLTQNLWQLLEETVDAEQGRLWIGGDGTLSFRGRHDRFDASVVWQVGGSGIPATASAPAFDLSEVVNRSVVELADGMVEVWEDEGSVADFGPRTVPVRDLPVTPPEAQALAMWEVYRWGRPRMWLDQLTIRPDSTSEPVVDAQVGDLVAWTMPTVDGDHVTSGHIERIRHEIRPKDWQVVWDLSPYVGEGPWLELAPASSGPDESDLDGDNMLAP